MCVSKKWLNNSNKIVALTLVLSNGGQRELERECDNGLLWWCVGVDTCTRRGGLKLGRRRRRRRRRREPGLFYPYLERLRGSIMQHKPLALFLYVGFFIFIYYFFRKVLSLYIRAHVEGKQIVAECRSIYMHTIYIRACTPNSICKYCKAETYNLTLTTANI